MDEISDQTNLIILEIEQIENMLELYKYIDDEEIIKIKVIKTTIENVEYRLKKINELL
jgi:hypothetical protein